MNPQTSAKTYHFTNSNKPLTPDWLILIFSINKKSNYFSSKTLSTSKSVQRTFKTITPLPAKRKGGLSNAIPKIKCPIIVFCSLDTLKLNGSL
jgi:hypothetical protein